MIWTNFNLIIFKENRWIAYLNHQWLISHINDIIYTNQIKLIIKLNFIYYLSYVTNMNLLYFDYQYDENNSIIKAFSLFFWYCFYISIYYKIFNLIWKWLKYKIIIWNKSISNFIHFFFFLLTSFSIKSILTYDIFD